MRTAPRALLAALLLAASCDDGPPPVEIPTELLAFYDTLRADADAFAAEGGGWTEDYGDAPFYGLGFYLHEGAARGDAGYVARADAARAYDLEVVRHANDDLTWYVENLEEALMAALGLIENASVRDDPEAMAAIDAVIDRTNDLLRTFGNYLPTGEDLGSFALTTYGPTAITAGAALLNLQYAVYLDTPRRQERIDRATTIADVVDRRARDGVRYRSSPDDERPELYPNAIMILVLCRLHELTGERRFVDRAEEAVLGIEVLRNTTRGGFNSPYSAEYMGAMTDDYSTLSSQNYITLGFLLLYEQTRDRRYLDEAFGVMEFVRTRLYDAGQRRLLHHWMDGRIAQPDDREYFCSGCNLQFLYVFWYLQARIAG
jgi:hypothetical protein